MTVSAATRNAKQKEQEVKVNKLLIVIKTLVIISFLKNMFKRDKKIFLSM